MTDRRTLAVAVGWLAVLPAQVPLLSGYLGALAKLAVLLLVVLWLSTRGALHVRPTLPVWVLALAAAGVASVVWSDARGSTVVSATQLVLGAAFAGLGWQVLGPARLLAALGGATAVALLGSQAAGMLTALAPVHPAWGLFLNPNEYARIGAVFLCCLPLLASRARGGGRLLLLVPTVLALRVVLLSGSSQARVALVLLVAVTLLAYGTASLGPAARAVGWLGAAAALVALWMTGTDWARLAGLVGEDVTLNSRTLIWARVQAAVLEDPRVGHGLSGFWGSPRVADITFSGGYVAAQAHSSFLEAALQLGVPAALLLYAGVLLVLRDAANAVLAHRPTGLSVSTAALAVVLTAWSFSGSLLFSTPWWGWTALVAVAVVASGERRTRLPVAPPAAAGRTLAGVP